MNLFIDRHILQLVVFVVCGLAAGAPALAYPNPNPDSKVPPAELATVQKINAKAIEGLTAGWAVYQAFFCSKWVHQVFLKAFPHKANEINQKLFGFSAVATARLWRSAGLTLTPNQIRATGGLRPGDVVFQEHGSLGFGHVGIVVNHDGIMKIAENSFMHVRRGDARGLIPLTSFGGITAVGRYREN